MEGDIIIDASEKAEKFIDTLEKSICDPAWKPTASVKAQLADTEEIRKLMAKRTGK